MSGFQTAFHELTLVLFTTLAPASVLACVMLSLLLVAGLFEGKERIRVQHMTVLPLALSMVGLVASATHLGTPSNALYVLTRIGQSPLSNEVAAAIVFLGLSGLCWLYSFALHPKTVLQQIGGITTAVTGVVCIGMIAIAYSEPTILTWSTWHVPVNVWLSALAGGPLLVVLTLRLAHARLQKRSFLHALYGVGGGAVLVGGLVLVMQACTLPTIRNGIGSADELVGIYPLMIAVYVLGALIAYAMSVSATRQRVVRSKEASLATLNASNVLFFAGLFAVRFGFYMMHMTAGISL